MKVIHVVGAVVVAHGQVLCVQRGPNGALAGMWEFPGGKIEPGESARDALRREIREELDCEITVGDEVTTTRHDYPFGTVVLTTFYCSLDQGPPRLIEHSDLIWCAPDSLHTLEWAPADIPAVHSISQHLSQSNA